MKNSVLILFIAAFVCITAAKAEVFNGAVVNPDTAFERISKLNMKDTLDYTFGMILPKDYDYDIKTQTLTLDFNSEDMLSYRLAASARIGNQYYDASLRQENFYNQFINIINMKSIQKSSAAKYNNVGQTLELKLNCEPKTATELTKNYAGCLVVKVKAVPADLKSKYKNSKQDFDYAKSEFVSTNYYDDILSCTAVGIYYINYKTKEILWKWER